MSDDPFIYGVVKSVEITGMETSKFGDAYPSFVAVRPWVTLVVPGLEDVRMDFPYQPDIGDRYRIEFIAGSWNVKGKVS